MVLIDGADKSFFLSRILGTHCSTPGTGADRGGWSRPYSAEGSQMHTVGSPQAPVLDVAVPHDHELITMDYATVAVPLAGTCRRDRRGPARYTVCLCTSSTNTFTGKASRLCYKG